MKTLTTHVKASIDEILKQSPPPAEPDSREWFAKYLAIELANPKLLVELNEAADKATDLETKVLELNVQIEKLKPSDSFASLRHLTDPDSVSEELKNLQTRRVGLIAEASQATRIYNDKRWDVQQDVHKQLQKGLLIAKGFLSPVTKDSQADIIPTDRWSFLRLDFQTGKALGEGLEYTGVTVARK